MHFLAWLSRPNSFAKEARAPFETNNSNRKQLCKACFNLESALFGSKTHEDLTKKIGTFFRVKKNRKLVLTGLYRRCRQEPAKAGGKKAGGLFKPVEKSQRLFSYRPLPVEKSQWLFSYRPLPATPAKAGKSRWDKSSKGAFKPVETGVRRRKRVFRPFFAGF